MSKNFEEVARSILKGHTLKNALDFAAFIRVNGLSLEGSGYLEAKYKDECVCYLKIDGDGSDDAPGHWHIWSADKEGDTWTYENCPVDEHIKEIAWAHICFCGSCGGDCSPGTRKMVLGKEFDNVCHSAMIFSDPDTEALDCAKKMVEIKLSDILKNT